MTETVSLVIKWAGKEYPIEGLTNTSSVLYLKELIYEKTNVLPARQKLLNLKLKGKLPIIHEFGPTKLDWSYRSTLKKARITQKREYP